MFGLRDKSVRQGDEGGKEVKGGERLDREGKSLIRQAETVERGMGGRLGEGKEGGDRGLSGQGWQERERRKFRRERDAANSGSKEEVLRAWRGQEDREGEGQGDYAAVSQKELSLNSRGKGSGAVTDGDSRNTGDVERSTFLSKKSRNHVLMGVGAKSALVGGDRGEERRFLQVSALEEALRRVQREVGGIAVSVEALQGEQEERSSEGVTAEPPYADRSKTLHGCREKITTGMQREVSPYAERSMIGKTLQGWRNKGSASEDDGGESPQAHRGESGVQIVPSHMTGDPKSAKSSPQKERAAKGQSLQTISARESSFDGGSERGAVESLEGKGGQNSFGALGKALGQQAPEWSRTHAWERFSRSRGSALYHLSTGDVTHARRSACTERERGRKIFTNARLRTERGTKTENRTRTRTRTHS